MLDISQTFPGFGKLNILCWLSFLLLSFEGVFRCTLHMLQVVDGRILANLHPLLSMKYRIDVCKSFFPTRLISNEILLHRRGFSHSILKHAFAYFSFGISFVLFLNLDMHRTTTQWRFEYIQSFFFHYTSYLEIENCLGKKEREKC